MKLYTKSWQLFPKFHDMPIKFEIFGKNDYSYKLESQNIIYAFTKYFISDTKKVIDLRNQKMELIFNLSVYESNEKIFDYFPNDIIYSEFIRVGIKFQQLKFFQAKEDFSFDIMYRVDNIDNDIVIYFDNMEEVNPFKYLLFEDKNELYENKTLYHLMKSEILENLIEGMRKILIIYPECDALYHFNDLRQYFTNNKFEIRYYINPYYCYRGKINYFNYEEINKIGDILQIKNIKTQIQLICYNDYGIGLDDYSDEINICIITFEYLNIYKNLTIEFGKLTKGYLDDFNILKQMINSIKL